MKTLIIIPTYNEKENIEKLINVLLENEIHPDILVIDDNSPDGTGEVVKKIATKNDRIKLIIRDGKKGLGSAYIRGFHYALENRYAYIFEMDADFSHSPDNLKDFIGEIQNHDVVVGSRYIKGGKIIGWNLIRYCISLGGNILSRTILRSPIKDMTSGYRCYKQKVLQVLALDSIISEGYFFQVEILYRTLLANFKCTEIPITFTDRQLGKSKMSGGIFWEGIINLLKIRRIKRYYSREHTEKSP
jgi:dolichol-phosphate mannosyltransferase